MDNRLVKVEKFLTFKPDRHASDYSLIEVNDSIRYNCINLVNKLEKIPQVYLCVRGDSKQSIEDHDRLFNYDLSKIFIVGQKSRSSIKTSPNQTYIHFATDPTSLITDVKRLVKIVNSEIANKPSSHNISGTIPEEFLRKLRNLDSEQLGKWKIFFLSFLHNNGSNKSFKDYSPFLSLTYGHKKYIISRHFALGRSKFKKGILFLYCLNAGWPYYIKTSIFLDELRSFGVNWYRDRHSEIMLIDGMYPHYLIGIFEVEPYKNSRFIINPWLYELLLTNQNFDYTNGLKIDQTYFHSFAAKLGYSNFFFHFINDTEEFVSEIDQINYNRVYRP